MRADVMKGWCSRGVSQRVRGDTGEGSGLLSLYSEFRADRTPPSIYVMGQVMHFWVLHIAVGKHLIISSVLRAAFPLL